jgi:hypothetical protein
MPGLLAADSQITEQKRQQSPHRLRLDRRELRTAWRQRGKEAGLAREKLMPS